MCVPFRWKFWKKKTEGSHEERVVNAMIRFADRTTDTGIEGLIREYSRVPYPIHFPCDAMKMRANRKKSRYSNILCFDHSRVALTYNVPPDTDYIHANRIVTRIVSLETNFICAQGPKEKTVDDFWRMVWQEKPKYIVMLTKVFENGVQKCSQYWPEKEGKTRKFGKIAVRNEGDGGTGDEQFFQISKLRVRAEGKEIIVKHARWLDWPDFGVPKSGFGLHRLMRKIDDEPQRYGEKNTVIVHCSGGIGRTGTFMTIEVIMKALLAGKVVRATKVLEELRKMRHALVQSSSQYVYIHFAICSKLERYLIGVPHASATLVRLNQFFEAYQLFAIHEEMRDQKRSQMGQRLINATVEEDELKTVRGE